MSPMPQCVVRAPKETHLWTYFGVSARKAGLGDHCLMSVFERKGLLSLARLLQCSPPRTVPGAAQRPRFTSSCPQAPEPEVVAEGHGPESAVRGVGLTYTDSLIVNVVTVLNFELICQPFKIETLHIKMPIFHFCCVIP